jgi:thymidylate synthase ThyX
VTISAKILLDSVGPSGKRLTTFELTYWRMIHAEFMTHRLFSRNAASSRAIPIDKMIHRIEEDCAGPIWWGKNQAGMQAAEELQGLELYAAKAEWTNAAKRAIQSARRLQQIGVHKQIVNRVIEPFMHITVICSATEYDNWFALRGHEMAMPEIAELARQMKKARNQSTPQRLKAGEWHLPLLDDRKTLENDRFPIESLKAISTGRCARVSYLTHDGVRDPYADVGLHDRLKAQTPGHWSPFEHIAQALETPTMSGNFRGWLQYRKTFKNEHIGGEMP